jgi:hypothetical protein
MKKSKSDYNLRTNSMGSIECIWPSSIPYSWNRIMKLKKLPTIKVQKSTRNTMAFLQETQRYIEHICKPMNLEEIHIVPSCYKPTSQLSLKHKQISSSKSSQDQRVKEIRSNFMRRRKKQGDLRKSVSPVQAGPLHRPTNSCSSIRISFREYEKVPKDC